jgi:adenosine deaminase
LFGTRLADQYRVAREVHRLDDDQLAQLARHSIEGSRAPTDVQAALLADVDAWLAAPSTRTS